MATYLNKRNGKLATLVSEDSKFKTVLLQYEDGSNTNVSIPTLKRWLKKLDTTNADPDTLRSYKKHIEANGLYVYGFVCADNKEGFERMQNLDEVAHIVVDVE